MRKNQTGIVTRLTVYHDGIRVGIGFHVWLGNMMQLPYLSTDNGEPLTEDWYTLMVESQHIAVINETVQ